MRNLITLMELGRPTTCENCEGIMEFRGLGQYKCDSCGVIDYDDYGKARNYIELNPGANVAQISEATGVSRKALSNMVREQRFEITAESRSFLMCELCGKTVRSGRVCTDCEGVYHKRYEEDVRKSHIKGGFGKGAVDEDSEGAKRFRRELF
ncbi:MAG: hypothetical protein LBC96_06895 [Lachnospiraceae bacterium]|jgi:ribosomal protein L32|nr:hypothetical protein [Lachnospiraceae bacterium]